MPPQPGARKSAGGAQVSLTAPDGKVFGPRGIGSVMVEIDRFCKRRLTTKRFRIAFNADGKVSLRRSDLNGTGVADGREERAG